VCPHFFHIGCAWQLVRTGPERLSACPLCRLPFDAVKRVPDMSDDPAAWFFCADADGTGQLSRLEVTSVLLSQFPVDVDKLEAALPMLWERWDQNGSGKISLAEFSSPNGMLESVVATLLKSERRGRVRPDPSARISGTPLDGGDQTWVVQGWFGTRVT